PCLQPLRMIAVSLLEERPDEKGAISHASPPLKHPSSGPSFAQVIGANAPATPLPPPRGEGGQSPKAIGRMGSKRPDTASTDPTHLASLGTLPSRGRERQRSSSSIPLENRAFLGNECLVGPLEIPGLHADRL